MSKIEIIPEKAKGSIELLEQLLGGDVKAISEALNISYPVVRNVISGRNAGDKKIIDAAQDLAAFYASVKLKDKRDRIINKLK